MENFGGAQLPRYPLAPSLPPCSFHPCLMLGRWDFWSSKTTTSDPCASEAPCSLRVLDLVSKFVACFLVVRNYLPYLLGDKTFFLVLLEICMHANLLILFAV